MSQLPPHPVAAAVPAATLPPPLPSVPVAAAVPAATPPPPPRDETDDAYQPDEPEIAFTRSDNHALGDLQLQPWTPSRIVAAQSMGMLHPNIGEEAMEQFRETGLYPGALADTLIVLYLCTLEKPAEIRRAQRKPNEAYEKALAWGADRGITDMRSPAFWEAYGKFIDIVSEVNASMTVPKNGQSGSDQGGATEPNP